MPSATNLLEAFPGVTGRGLRVAVVDSGVHAGHPHVNGVSGGLAIGVQQRFEDYSDVLGHGTAVLAAIKDIAPNAEYFAVKIYFRTLRTNIDQLIQALNWSIDNQMDVVNLSLGTVNQDHRQTLATLIDRAVAQGMIIVAAAEADGEPALPGSLPGVISASIDWMLERGTFRHEMSPHGGYRWLVSGYPRDLPGLPREKNLKGISFAVANLTGIVLRASEIASDRSFAAMTRLLCSESNRLAAVTEQLHTL